MATADIAKQAVFDQRIIQHSPAYAVNKGALSLTAVPFSAISQTTSQHTYNCPIPSQNVFVDRAVDWTATAVFRVQVDRISTPRGANEPILAFGKDCAFTSFPLHSLVQTMTATINDTTTTMNTSDVLKEILRLTSTNGNKKSRTCPTMDDTYYSYDDAYLTVNSPLSGYGEAVNPDYVPNGAYPQVYFTNAQGALLTGNGTYNDENGLAVSYTAGVPVRSVASDAGQPVLYIQLTSTEKLVLSPFIFANSHEWETGLFGINAIQFVMNLGSPSRVLRTTKASGRQLVGQVGYPTTLTGGNQPFSNSRVLFQILTPSLDVPLPPKSVVPYMEFPRYITNFTPSQNVPGTQTGAVGGTITIPSQTIVLPQIPDMLIIYAKPQTYADTTFGDYHFPPTSISLNFDNFAGLLSAHQQSQLYQMAVHNGLEMDYAQWVGQAYLGKDGKDVPSVGGFLILRPGVDFALQSGQAPGLAGNFVLQYNLTIQNTTSADLVANTTTISLYTIAVNAGFFESMAGSSRVVKAVVSEADIISAEPSAVGSGDELKRLVGAGFLDNLGNMFNKAVGVYETTKPIISAVKNLLPDSGVVGKVKDVAGKVGYGLSGGSPGGIGASGGRRKGLSARLM
ncbi:hypothetical protein EBZ38_14995 [bacterium]|nr:hypothetical protein [bacterium]NBW78231.1 hypothetical protein [Betaproteobacteria bacterium]NDC95933.1 hypothetical protein [bacterium]NDD85566.1 hypothetical protein [bacterium]